MKVAIYGAGAMGTVLGAHLSRAGQQVDLITRNISHINALKQRGATVVGTVNFTVPVSALLPGEMTEKYDIVFLMTKQRENKSTVKFLLDYLAEDGVICTTQNGLPEMDIIEVCGENKCVGCAISWGATFVGEGVAELTSSPDKLTFAIGSLQGNNPKLSLIQSILEKMGKVTVEQNFIGARWAKLCVNSAFSSISAITGLTFGEVAKKLASRKVAQAILNEAFTVATKSGVKVEKIQGHDLKKLLGYTNPIKKAISFMLIPLAMKKHKNLKSGMLFDLLKGKKCDIDFINGAIVGVAKKCGVKTPVNDAVLAIAHKIEQGELSVSPNNLKLIKI
ncbi:MAG: ketopantoate reductase family protein [Clostridiales bacterium]|nr:ketopantoate reductase family protein [Clostridiales bacterium]